MFDLMSSLAPCKSTLSAGMEIHRQLRLYGKSTCVHVCEDTKRTANTVAVVLMSVSTQHFTSPLLFVSETRICVLISQ